MKNALLIGDTKQTAKYHPLEPVQSEIADIISKECTTDVSYDYDILLDELKNYDILIIYNDMWEKTLSNEQANAIINFVKHGNPLLLLHGGISIAEKEILYKTVGAKFAGHPESTDLKFTTSNDSFALDKKSFCLFEEPYTFDFYDKKQLTDLLYYEYKDEKYLSGFYKIFGKGKIVYLHPGHDAKVFSNIEYRKLILKCIKWCL